MGVPMLLFILMIGYLLSTARAFGATRDYGPRRLGRTHAAPFSSSIDDQREVSSGRTSQRLELLTRELVALQIDTIGLEQAAILSIQDPTRGYDGRYGKSAIKAYRSFLYPKASDGGNSASLKGLDLVQLEAAAGRCARQIDFLLKRHKSHMEEFVRHHDQSLNASRKTFPLILILDNMRSAFNVGSIFRTADATGCSMVITTGITPHPGGSGDDKLNKSALGAEYLVPHRHFATTRKAIDFVRSEMSGYQIVGMETTERSVSYTDFSYDRKKGVALCLGNEVTGVDTDLMSELDVLVEIPMYGAKNSLNVASCAPVVLYEILRQWNAVGTNDVKE